MKPINWLQLHLNNLFGRVDYESWSKIALISILFVTPSLAHAETGDDALFLSTDTLVKIILALTTIIVVNALIPMVKSSIRNWKEQRTFRTYLQAHVKNAIESYEHEHSIDFAKQELLKGELDGIEWLNHLEAGNRGAPNTLIDMHNAIYRAESDEGHEKNTFPSLLTLV